MIRTAFAFALLLTWTAIGTADDDAKKTRPGAGRFDPKKLDPEKLKAFQDKLKEKGFDREKFKNLTPEQRKEMIEKFKGKGGKGGFDREKFKDLTPEQRKEMIEKFKGKGGFGRGKGGFKGKKPE